MNQLIIKTEGKPSKCEICHQSDVFDVETQVCLRCRDLVGVPSFSKLPPVEDPARRFNGQFETTGLAQFPFDEDLVKGEMLAIVVFVFTWLVGLALKNLFGFFQSENLVYCSLLGTFFLELLIAWRLKSKSPRIVEGFTLLTVVFIIIFLFFLWMNLVVWVK